MEGGGVARLAGLPGRGHQLDTACHVGGRPFGRGGQGPSPVCLTSAASDSRRCALGRPSGSRPQSAKARRTCDSSGMRLIVLAPASTGTFSAYRALAAGSPPLADGGFLPWLAHDRLPRLRTILTSVLVCVSAQGAYMKAAVSEYHEDDRPLR